jgi:hypothetical protein
MGANWYERNKEYQKENSKMHRVEDCQSLREYAWEYLSTYPCVDCGESHPAVWNLITSEKGRKM